MPARALLRRSVPLALLAAFWLQGACLVFRTGVTYDEPVHIAAGFRYWHDGLGFFTHQNPPLMDYLRALPLLALRPSSPQAPRGQELFVSADTYGQMFLFGNRLAPRLLLRSARMMSLLLGLLLAVVLWRWTASVAGETAGTAALFCFAFDPNMLAHCTLATSDMGVPAFALMSLAAWERHLTLRTPGWACAAGLAAGAALTSKATGLVLLPAMAASLLWARAAAWRASPASAKTDLIPLAWAWLSAAAVLLVVYPPAQLHRYLEMVRFHLVDLTRPIPTFLFGRVYPQGHPLYYPAVILMKTPLPLLGLAGLGLLRLRARPDRTHALRALFTFLVLLLIAVLRSQRQLGVRYLLPLYPAFCALAGIGVAALWERPLGRRVALAAAACLLGGSLAVFPFPLTYFNALAGLPSRGQQVLADHNLDWGQALPELQAFLARNPGGLILSYFGKDCPEAYGLEAQHIFSTPGLCTGQPTLLPPDIGREWLAIGATKWQGAFETGAPVFGWLRARTPAATLGRSLFVYDVTEDADAHRQLAGMYETLGNPAAAARERARAGRIEAAHGTR
ncbi:MAG TPA: hypothetical protein DD417_02910 [Elusimicrobia bacterium]|nr:hypothetical protein [Elusimicrobiota bacterium]